MIRRARASDISRVAALYHAVWHETQAPLMPQAEITHRSMEFFTDRMMALLQSTLVTERNGEVVAFSAWRGRLLGQLFVAIPHRGTRVASSLLTASEIEMTKEDVAEAELRCVVGNERARRFYERMGWQNREKIIEQLTGGCWPGPAPTGEQEQIGVPFWRMTKVLTT